MKNKKQFYLVGNAHLDPVWQWRWQEGSAEAKATIRSALDRMKEYPEFKFVCSSASVFKWIEEFDPEMLEEIKLRISEGRFVLVGGWHVQPDCNMPSGEGFARQTLYSQRYFMEKFGHTAKVGYNVDSFGHNYNLPQILRKSGMNQYIFMRPAPYEKDMDSDIFNWFSPDGSSVLTYRILDPYCCNFNDGKELQERIDYLNESTKTDLDCIPLFYGVGNHGGGPTIKNIESLLSYKKEHPDFELHFSNLEDFFDRVRRDGYSIPEHHDDLQHHAPGCYSTVSHVKNGIRRGETSLISAESFSILANNLCNKPVKNDKIQEAWEKICFLHFHDSMCGCCIKEAHEDARYTYGAVIDTAETLSNNALQTLSWAVDTSCDKEKGLPVFVFNPHPFEVEQFITVNKYADTVVDVDGNEVENQLVRSSVKECFERDDVCFIAKVPPLGYSVYYLVGAEMKGFGLDLTKRAKFEARATAIGYSGNYTANALPRFELDNEYLNIKFDPVTGYVASVFDKEKQVERLSDYACVPTVIDEYFHDTWSHSKNFFTKEIGKFADGKITVIESGPIRATLKVESRYNDSTIAQYFTLYAGKKELYVKVKLNWNEKHKMLKLAWPFDVKNPKAYYEIPFGVIERPCDGEEEPGQTWFGVKGDNGGFAICNSDTYSSSVKDGTLYHTVVRSPIYGDHGGPRDEESDFTDQGLREFSYVLTPFDGSNADIIKKARVLNAPLTNVIENWHSGKIKDKIYGGLQIDKDNIILSAIKRAEDGNGLVIRLYETEGEDTDFTLNGDLIRVPLNAKIGKFAFKTYYLADGCDEWKEVLLSEYAE